MYCIYFYAENGINLQNFYLLELKDLKDIFPTTMFNTMLKTRRVMRQVNACLQKNHANILGLLNIDYF